MENLPQIIVRGLLAGSGLYGVACIVYGMSLLSGLLDYRSRLSGWLWCGGGIFCLVMAFLLHHWRKNNQDRKSASSRIGGVRFYSHSESERAARLHTRGAILLFVGDLALLLGVTTYPFLGGNTWTQPRFPRPGERVRIELHSRSTGIQPSYLVSEGFSLSFLQVQDNGGVLHQWWVDGSIAVERGSRQEIVPGLVKYRTVPITGERVGGPYAVTKGRDVSPTVEFTVADRADMSWLTRAQNVVFKCITAGGERSVTFRLFPAKSLRLALLPVVRRAGVVVFFLILGLALVLCREALRASERSNM